MPVRPPHLALAGALVLCGLAVAGLLAPSLIPPRLTLQTMDEALGVPALADRGTCDLWARDASDPSRVEERSFPCTFAWTFVGHEDGTTLLHEQLRDDRGEVVRPGGDPRANLEEWFPVRNGLFAHDAFTFAFPGGEDGGVFTPPAGARDHVGVGWVTSDGRPDGTPRVQLVREFREVGEGMVEDLPVVRWEASFAREPVTWHGTDQLRTEVEETVTHPRTGFLLEKRKRVVVEMTPTQLTEAFGAPALPMAGGEEPVKVVDLTYETTAASRAEHVEKARRFLRLLWPVDHGPSFSAVAALGALALGRVAWRARHRGGRG